MWTANNLIENYWISEESSGCGTTIKEQREYYYITEGVLLYYPVPKPAYSLPTSLCYSYFLASDLVLVCTTRVYYIDCVIPTSLLVI